MCGPVVAVRREGVRKDDRVNKGWKRGRRSAAFRSKRHPLSPTFTSTFWGSEKKNCGANVSERKRRKLKSSTSTFTFSPSPYPSSSPFSGFSLRSHVFSSPAVLKPASACERTLRRREANLISCFVCSSLRTSQLAILSSGSIFPPSWPTPNNVSLLTSHARERPLLFPISHV